LLGTSQIYVPGVLRQEVDCDAVKGNPRWPPESQKTSLRFRLRSPRSFSDGDATREATRDRVASQSDGLLVVRFAAQPEERFTLDVDPAGAVHYSVTNRLGDLVWSGATAHDGAEDASGSLWAAEDSLAPDGPDCMRVAPSRDDAQPALRINFAKSTFPCMSLEEIDLVTLESCDGA